MQAYMNFIILTMLQKTRLPNPYSLLIILICFITFSCSSVRIVREFHNPSDLNVSTLNKKTIKVHMTDGSIYLLDSLINNNKADTVSGYGSYYNQYREIVLSNKGPEGNLIPPAFLIPLSQVALFETNNVSGMNGKALAMTLIGVPTAILDIYCILNPKACFGSCPTFYCWDGKDTVLMAEGFSSSILRLFEKKDVDMLYDAKPSGNTVNIKLTNEALETHVIRYADLLAIPRNHNERVFASGNGSFTRVSEILTPSSCTAPEGDCLTSILKMDQKERYSKTDEKNLAAKEYIYLNFESLPQGETGLIIGSRQTFLTTFLFYQSLAYMGNLAGNFAASIESGNKSLTNKVERVWNMLGGIEIAYQENNGKWVKAGTVDEMGPIASDVHLIPLPLTHQNTLKVRLCLTKGLWRIDYLALAKLGARVEPVRIKPTVRRADIENCGTYNKPLLSDTLDPLITLPGDSYYLTYVLPATSTEYELFLYSKGYYIEWMRETWLEEQNLKKASLMFGFPGLFMKMAAREFKQIEPVMEENFWKSRYVRKD